MQDGKRITPCFGCRVALVAAVLVLLASSACAQNSARQKECENLLAAAAGAEQQNDLIEAELRYDECIALAKQCRLPKMEAAAIHRLAVIRARNKKFSESANLFQHALELDQQNALILCDYAQLHADRRDFDEAEKLFKKALDADPNNQKILFNLGNTIASQRGNREAEGLRYLKLAVGEAEAYRELERIYRSKGDLPRAEFAAQKAQIAESQPSTSRMLANTLPGNSAVPVRLPHQAQTPPEIRERVRQEIVDAEIHDMINAPKNPVMPSVDQPPSIPAPTIPERRTVAATAAPIGTATPLPTVVPLDPFTKETRRQESTPSLVRQLKPPQTSFSTQSDVRTIPSHSGPLSVIQSSVQNNIPSPFAPIPIEEINSTSNDSSEPPLFKITSSAEADTPVKTEENSPSSLHVLASDRQPTNVSPVRALPSGAKAAERTDIAKTNPLRQIPHDDSGLIDPVSEVTIIAALPSYTSVGTQRIPRIDQKNLPERSENVPGIIAPPLSVEPEGLVAFEFAKPTEETFEVVRTPRALPVRDFSVPQSSTPVVALKESPVHQSVSTIVAPTAENGSNHIANLFAEHSETVTALPEYVKIVQSERGFASANAPDVLQFSPAAGDLPPAVPADKPIEVAVRPLTQESVPQDARSVVPLPLIASRDSDPQMVRIVNDTPSASVIAATQEPFLTANAPMLAEVKTFEPPIPIPTVPFEDPFLAASRSPMSSEVSTLEMPVPIVTATQDPFLAASRSPMLADVKSFEPPVPVATAVTDPFHTAANNPPMFTEGKKLEHLPRVVPSPVEHSTVIETQPILPTRVIDLPEPVLVKDEPAGFASTRKAEQRVAAADDQAGFASSKR